MTNRNPKMPSLLFSIRPRFFLLSPLLVEHPSHSLSLIGPLSSPFPLAPQSTRGLSRDDLITLLDRRLSKQEILHLLRHPDSPPLSARSSHSLPSSSSPSSSPPPPYSRSVADQYRPPALLHSAFPDIPVARKHRKHIERAHREHREHRERRHEKSSSRRRIEREMRTGNAEVTTRFCVCVCMHFGICLCLCFLFAVDVHLCK